MEFRWEKDIGICQNAPRPLRGYATLIWHFLGDIYWKLTVLTNLYQVLLRTYVIVDHKVFCNWQLKLKIWFFWSFSKKCPKKSASIFSKAASNSSKRYFLTSSFRKYLEKILMIGFFSTLDYHPSSIWSIFMPLRPLLNQTWPPSLNGHFRS